MVYKVGDKVSLLDENAQAYVLEVLTNGFLRIEIDDDFHTQTVINTSKLANYSEICTYKPNKLKKKDSIIDNSRKKTIKKSQQELNKFTLEVDLHLNSDFKVDNFLEFQLNKVREILIENKNKKGLKIIFIHGNGKGILRNEIIKLLKKNFPQYKISDASMSKYGLGALEVLI